jgi:Chromo (CHRromatin Organisation MOdifier) domain
VANDRVRTAPIQRDLPEGLILSPRAEPNSPEEGAEYVIDRLVGHGNSPDDEIAVRVRWAGYSDEDDTWEKAEDLPSELVLSYAKRKNLPLSDLGLGSVGES